MIFNLRFENFCEQFLANNNGRLEVPMEIALVKRNFAR